MKAKKCNKCSGKMPEESDREVCDHCFSVACCVNSKELYEELESVSESLNEAIDMLGDKVDKDTLHGWQAARDDAWNLLRRLEK